MLGVVFAFGKGNILVPVQLWGPSSGSVAANLKVYAVVAQADVDDLASLKISVSLM